jgi:hypothetical protein
MLVQVILQIIIRRGCTTVSFMLYYKILEESSHQASRVSSASSGASYQLKKASFVVKLTREQQLSILFRRSLLDRFFFYP